jgi:hypothetical protein
MLMHSEDQNQHTSFLSLISPRDDGRARGSERTPRARGRFSRRAEAFVFFFFCFFLTDAR